MLRNASHLTEPQLPREPTISAHSHGQKKAEFPPAQATNAFSADIASLTARYWLELSAFPGQANQMLYDVGGSAIYTLELPPLPRLPSYKARLIVSLWRSILGSHGQRGGGFQHVIRQIKRLLQLSFTIGSLRWLSSTSARMKYGGLTTYIACDVLVEADGGCRNQTNQRAYLTLRAAQL